MVIKIDANHGDNEEAGKSLFIGREKELDEIIDDVKSKDTILYLYIYTIFCIAKRFLLLTPIELSSKFTLLILTVGPIRGRKGVRIIL